MAVNFSELLDDFDQVFDALDLPHPIGNGLRSIADLGVRTFGFSHAIHHRPVPSEEVRVELRAPNGMQLCTWGPPAAANKVTGAALDFVLVVTQRRHIDQTALVATGPCIARTKSGSSPRPQPISRTARYPPRSSSLRHPGTSEDSWQRVQRCAGPPDHCARRCAETAPPQAFPTAVSPTEAAPRR